MDMYNLATSGMAGPIPSQPTSSTSVLFCIKSPTPSVSSNGTAANTGIVWAIEKRNSANSGNAPNCGGTAMKAALRAFDATDVSRPELYDSTGLGQQHQLGGAVNFSTPIVFKGRVYIATTTTTNVGEVDVFGLCGQPSQCLQ